MPFRDSLSSLRDIDEAIESVERFILGMDFSVFKADEKTNAAVERKLLLLSEAARRLGDDAEKLCPSIPWNNIRRKAWRKAWKSVEKRGRKAWTDGTFTSLYAIAPL